MHAFLSIFAQGLVAVYIPNASAWVNAAQEGRGHAFFLQHLVSQNADLIAANPVLHEALLPALHDGQLDATVMNALRTALQVKGCPGVGVIVDEVQNITAALAVGRQPGAALARQQAADYFKQVSDGDGQGGTARPPIIMYALHTLPYPANAALYPFHLLTRAISSPPCAVGELAE